MDRSVKPAKVAVGKDVKDGVEFDYSYIDVDKE